MLPYLNRQLYDAIFRQDIEAISTLIQEGAVPDLKYLKFISSTDLDGNPPKKY